MDLPSTSSQGGGEGIVGSKGVAKKDELVRLITKLLYSLGYDRAAGKSVKEESGIQLHIERVNLFMEQIMDGKWDESLATLRDIGKYVDEISLVMLKNESYELLCRGEVIESLNTLRPMTASLGNSDEVVYRIFSLIESLPKNVCGHESGFRSLDKVLEDLQDLLIVMAKQELITSHRRKREEVPYKTIQKLKVNKNEVWFLQFSHNGTYLAASTSNSVVSIWKLLKSGSFSPPSTLVGHIQPISSIAWSPDDSQLLTCGVDETVKRWDIAPTGGCLHTYQKQNLGTVSCVWAPDAESIFTGLNDGSIIMWNLQGEELRSWDGKTTMIADLAITCCRRELITTFRYDTILLLEWETGSERFIKEDDDIVSFSLSKDGNLLLVSTSNEEIHLWNIVLPNPQKEMTYKGHTRQRFVVRACFGGIDQSLIFSGSEDSQVYIWDRVSGERIRKLEGHSAAVNCVSCNPADPRMMASGSDDGTVRIWRDSS